MKILTRYQIYNYYITDDLSDDEKEYYLKLLSSLDEDEFDRMIKKDFNGVFKKLRKGYYIE